MPVHPETTTASETSNRRRTLTDDDLSRWIANDNYLLDWWSGSQLRKREFIRQNRAKIIEIIERELKLTGFWDACGRIIGAPRHASAVQVLAGLGLWAIGLGCLWASFLAVVWLVSLIFGWHHFLWWLLGASSIDPT
jgi:hypothetical protein